MTDFTQQDIIRALGVVHPDDFDVDKEIRKRINFLKSYLINSNLNSYVLGISGGIDSTTAGKLAQIAVDELDREEFGQYFAQFVAVRLPYGVQHDEAEAETALDFINPDTIEIVNIKESVLALDSYLILDDFHKGNVKARMRMITQYAIAGQNGGLVIGTDHAAEAVMGFFTKFGDGAADILPLAGLNKRRVRAIAERLGAPPELVNKVPTADLEDNKPGLPDEVAYGVTYDQIDDFLEGKEIDPVAHDTIIRNYIKTQHKRNPPVTP